MNTSYFIAEKNAFKVVKFPKVAIASFSKYIFGIRAVPFPWLGVLWTR